MHDRSLTFGPFSYDRTIGTLWRDGLPLHLGGRAASILRTLLDADGDVVPRDTLIDAAWNGAIVEDGNLAVQIAGLRKVLGPREDGEEWIVTVPRVGYRLPRQSAPASSTVKPSLAILPFINMSGDPEQEHFADGMVEDLITMFSRFRNFSVIARHSSFVYKHRQFDIRDAARALGVRYLIEGSVRRVADRVRVTAQLIEGETGAHIWAEKLDGKMGDVFDFQDRITGAVIGLIEPRIRQAEIERARRVHPSNLAAYDLYWRALPLLQSSHGRAYSEAADLLDQAVPLEPNFGPILAMAAYAHIKRLSWGQSPPGVDDRKIGHHLVQRALDVDPLDPVALLAAAGDAYADGAGNLDAALDLARQSYALNPNSQVICNTAGWYEWVSGNYDAALACAMRGLELSPSGPERFWSLGSVARDHLSAGNVEEALVWALRTVDANHEVEEAHATAIACYALLGEIEEARRALNDLVSIAPEATLAGLASTYAGPHYTRLREGLASLEAAAAEPPA